MSDNRTTTNTEHAIAARRNAFTPRFSLPVLLTICVFAAILFISNWSHAAPAKTTASKSPQEIVYPAGQFDDGKARFYEFKTEDGVKIKYFVLKSSDGVVRAAFDACDVCWREGKGYTQKDDFMVCDNCGRRFKSTRVNEVSGGCNPAPLVRKTENGKVIIKVDDVLTGKRFFTRGG
ncbi:MAG TPA: DUF2318 domain-containing protein [Syntrophorhabdaceae bacterium]|nr:DUF2318 domain-containing protein [Syntrophorhabdaceae bacterium]